MIDRKEIGEGMLTEEQEIYRENILDHYKNPRNAGVLSTYSCRHRELNPLCGDELEVFLSLNQQQRVHNIKFTGVGCAISQAAMSMLTEEVKGKSLEDVKKISPQDVLEMLGIPVGVVRMKCALLCLKTLHGSLNGESR